MCLLKIREARPIESHEKWMGEWSKSEGKRRKKKSDGAGESLSMDGFVRRKKILPSTHNTCRC
jgi:hypothetical protein